MRKMKSLSGINTILIILIVFANIYLFSMNLTNSKYISESVGDANAQVSNWNVKLKYNGTTITTTYNIDLNSTINNRKIIPGMQGAFPITIDTSECNTSIPIKYEIKISKKSNVPNNMSFWITNDTEKFIIDSTYFGTTTGGTNTKETINWKWNFTDIVENNYENSNFSLNLEITVYSI